MKSLASGGINHVLEHILKRKTKHPQNFEKLTTLEFLSPTSPKPSSNIGQ
jgi:hypothetical protein